VSNQNAGRSRYTKIDNSFFGRTEEFKYLRTKLIDQNFIQKEIKRRLKSGNVCYHSLQNILSSRLPSKYLKIKMYCTVILPGVLYGRETWSLTLMEKLGLRVFDNRVWRTLHEERNDLKSLTNIVLVIN
jgi:hypothetical protein